MASPVGIAGIELGEPDAFFRQPIEVRGRDVLLAVAAQVAAADARRPRGPRNSVDWRCCVALPGTALLGAGRPSRCLSTAQPTKPTTRQKTAIARKRAITSPFATTDSPTAASRRLPRKSKGGERLGPADRGIAPDRTATRTRFRQTPAPERLSDPAQRSRKPRMASRRRRRGGWAPATGQAPRR